MIGAVNPFGFLIVLVIFIVGVITIALVPTFPKSRLLLFCWLLCLAIIIALIYWVGFVNELPYPAAWRAPFWLGYLHVFLLMLPFIVSLSLRQFRSKELSLFNRIFTFILMCCFSVGLFYAVQIFHHKCVYFGHYQISGKAWCPVSWQAVKIPRT